MRPSALLERARTTLPEGTFAVGAGLGVAAITAYIFVIVALNALGDNDEAVAGFSALWAIVFVAGLGLFQPLEQEISRAVAHRNAQGIGGGPVIKRAARFGAAMAAVVCVIALALYPVLTEHLFHGQGMLVFAFVIALSAHAVMHLARGALSGNARFGPYGFMIGAEGTARFLAAVALMIAGVTAAGPYGLLLGLAPYVAVILTMRKQRGLIVDGPPAPWSEIAPALGFLLVGSVATQALAYAPLMAIGILAGPGDQKIVAVFTTAFFLARVPVLMFMAVQAALLPKLAKYTGAGRHDDFRAALRQLFVVVIGVAVLGVILAALLGPIAGEILFKNFDPNIVSARDLALLAAGSGGLIVALTAAQALIALDGHAHAMWGWLAGVVGFLLGVSLISDLLLRVEIGFLAGAMLSALVMGALLLARMRRGLPTDTRPLVEAIEHEQFEF